jgi:predicted alpha/beta-hydrolase family hydrolase
MAMPFNDMVGGRFVLIEMSQEVCKIMNIEPNIVDGDHFLWDGPADAAYVIILAHGAGQPMDAPFMETMVTALLEVGLLVGRFEFPYMARRRTTGKKALPDRLPVLCETWRQAVNGIDRTRLIVGGKSMGGRIASMIADEIGAAGLVCLGYPFHPPGKSEQLRVGHLADLQTPSLFCQGERDTFGSRSDVARYDLSPAIRLEWLSDGDHSFIPRKTSGRSQEQNLAQAATAISDFIYSLGAS